MNRVNKLEVFYHNRLVGTLALYKGMYGAFEYSKQWLLDGFSLSPFTLPLEKKVFMPKIDPFEGLFGAFDDSLPDGWGRLLVDRLMRKNGMNPELLGCLDRLAIVGDSGMGALTYRPIISIENNYDDMPLDEVARLCRQILISESTECLDYLFANGGSSGGARPKILTKVNGEDWIIKFPSTTDSDDIGLQEYRYAQCAQNCGINVPEYRLFDSSKTEGFFGMKRFDRVGPAEDDKIHMLSASALLETSHRMPNLDYNILMQLTLQLTHSFDECEQLFRRMCFNVFSHNRDDHSKNFSYLYVEKDRRWVLSPAYDMTYSNSIGGEHATTVNGNGADPSMDDLMMVAEKIGINLPKAKRIAVSIEECVYNDLGEYLIR